MSIRFKLVRNNIKSHKDYGKYYAHTLRGDGLSLEQIEQTIEANCSAKVSDVRLVMSELFATIRQALRDGRVVCMGDLGKLYLSVESIPVDSSSDFRVDSHVKGFRCNYIPCGHRRKVGDKAVRVKRLLTEGCRAVHDKKATQQALENERTRAKSTVEKQ